MVRTVLRAPGVARVFLASMVGRIPAGALGLLLILRVRELGGGYADGGLVAGALSLGLGAAAPLVGRVVDARGQTRVLAASATACGGALAALALAPAGTPLAALLALAAVAGAAHPPLAACLRALWPALLPDAARRHAAFALESVALEISYILGPLVLVGAVATHSAALALGVCVALIATGTVAFAAAPGSRDWRPVAGVRRGLLGALASPGIRVLLAAQASVGFSFGAIEVSVVAFAEDAGARGAIGVLLAGWGLASMAGGALAIRVGAPRDPARRLVVLVVALAAGDALLVVATGTVALGVLLFVAGLAIAPVFTIIYNFAGDAAREGTVTEAFTWLGTGLSVGLAAGSAAAGTLASAGGARAGFLAAAAAAGVAAAIAAACRGDLGPAVSSPDAGAAGASSRASRRGWRGAPARGGGTRGLRATPARRDAR
jgi:MFS family permease